MPTISPIDHRIAALAAAVALRIREERRRRRWSLRELGLRAGISPSLAHWIESGHAGSIETYVRIAGALGLRLELDLIDPRRRDGFRREDAVHALIVELLARRIRPTGVSVEVDEPYQHYQFAGRGDLVAWSVAERSLLHTEVRTQFPNLQDAFGSYNAKRRWLAASVADRIGLREGFQSVTHAIVALWSSDVVHAIRRHPDSFRSVAPDPPDAFIAWWDGLPPLQGISSTLVVLDPDPAGRRDRRRLAGLDDAIRLRPRYKGYAEAAALLGPGVRG
jgi:transcriptional regulator with XRE-family HTH domain